MREKREKREREREKKKEKERKKREKREKREKARTRLLSREIMREEERKICPGSIIVNLHSILKKKDFIYWQKCSKSQKVGLLDIR